MITGPEGTSVEAVGTTLHVGPASPGDPTAAELDTLAAPDPLERELAAAQANYGGMMSPRLSISQRVQRRTGFSDGYRARATQEVESGVVRVRIEAETIDRCARELYDVDKEAHWSNWPAWELVSPEEKQPYLDQVKTVFAVLPMQP